MIDVASGKRAILFSSPLRQLRRLVSTSPAIYMPLRKMRNPGTVVNPRTELLIEGFPRSGNTWTEALIRHCRPEGIELAHHSHAAAHVKHALTLGVPVIVLYREPDDAVRSLLTLYDNMIDPRDAYLDYVAFYRAILEMSERNVLKCSFEDATKNPLAVVDALNRRFSLGLSTEGLGTKVSDDAIFRLMDEKGARLKRRDGKSNSRPGMASDSQMETKLLAIEATEAPAVQDAREAAIELYGQMISALACTSGT